jgi:hypothetical protein
MCARDCLFSLFLSPLSFLSFLRGQVLFLEGNPLRVPVPCLPEATHRSFATNPSAIHAYLSLYRYGRALLRAPIPLLHRGSSFADGSMSASQWCYAGEGGNADENDEQRITREDARQSLERMVTSLLSPP